MQVKVPDTLSVDRAVGYDLHETRSWDILRSMAIAAWRMICIHGGATTLPITKAMCV